MNYTLNSQLYANDLSHSLAITLLLELTFNFMADISASISVKNTMIKSISLCFHISSTWKLVISIEISYPLSGFRLRISKSSALCIKNLENLSANIISIASLVLILMEIRTALIEPSIKMRDAMEIMLADKFSRFLIL